MWQILLKFVASIAIKSIKTCTIRKKEEDFVESKILPRERLKICLLQQCINTAEDNKQLRTSNYFKWDVCTQRLSSNVPLRAIHFPSMAFLDGVFLKYLIIWQPVLVLLLQSYWLVVNKASTVPPPKSCYWDSDIFLCLIRDLVSSQALCYLSVSED